MSKAEQAKDRHITKKAIKIVVFALIFMTMVMGLFVAVMGYLYFGDPTHPLAAEVMAVAGQGFMAICITNQILFLVLVTLRFLGIRGLKILERFF